LSFLLPGRFSRVLKNRPLAGTTNQSSVSSLRERERESSSWIPSSTTFDLILKTPTQQSSTSSSVIIIDHVINGMLDFEA
jgi:hypothetical protein